MVLSTGQECLLENAYSKLVFQSAVMDRDRKPIASKFKNFLNDDDKNGSDIVKAFDKCDVIDWDDIKKLSPTGLPLVISMTLFSSFGTFVLVN